ncbi:hypothetical protein BpHYR1_031146 [Brachionus plicatilis]|uniref:Uncharacterized protein n=1 Tax=Brachionus plicatilis TaxID=10195 RepID=A0A3M7SDI6_BRAPC|nr:hypothetical protein BpHYR1_031146 [Brachionus plicatilis]
MLVSIEGNFGSEIEIEDEINRHLDLDDKGELNLKQLEKQANTIDSVNDLDVTDIEDENEQEPESPAELAPVIHYFEKNYIGLVDSENKNCSRNGSKMVYLGQIIAWRLGISLEVSQDVGSHPNVNKLAKHQKNEQHLADLLIEKINSGIVYPREKSEIKKDNEIMSLFSI